MDPQSVRALIIHIGFYCELKKKRGSIGMIREGGAGHDKHETNRVPMVGFRFSINMHIKQNLKQKFMLPLPECQPMPNQRKNPSESPSDSRTYLFKLDSLLPFTRRDCSNNSLYSTRGADRNILAFYVCYTNFGLHSLVAWIQFNNSVEKLSRIGRSSFYAVFLYDSKPLHGSLLNLGIRFDTYHIVFLGIFSLDFSFRDRHSSAVHWNWWVESYFLNTLRVMVQWFLYNWLVESYRMGWGSHRPMYCLTGLCLKYKIEQIKYLFQSPLYKRFNPEKDNFW